MSARTPVLLSYRTLGLGDLLTAVPALRALRRAFPDHHHVHAARPTVAPLLPLIGAVDGHLALPELGAVPLGDGAVDVAVDLHGSGPQSHRVLQALHPGRLIAYGQPAAGHEGPAWHEEDHEVLRWCRLLGEHGIPADPTDLHLSVPLGPVHPLAPGCTVIHPGAAAGSRRWPADRFAVVAAAEREAGRAVLITGSAAERPLAKRVGAFAGIPEGEVLAGRTDLLELARTLALAGRLVCGDTGVAHLATAVRTPSVVLFGPTEPARWGPPPGLSERHVVLWAGRTGDPHADEPDPGLLALTPDLVIDALAALTVRPDPLDLGGRGPGSGGTST